MQRESKYLPIISTAVLLICAILLIVVASCSDTGMLYVEYSVSGSWYASSSGESVGWDIDGDGTASTCTSSATAVGAFSIISFILIILGAAAFVYFRMYRKREDKIFGSLYQRQLLMIFSVVLLVVLLISSIAYYAACRDAILSSGYVFGWYVEFTDVLPDYGLVLLWLVCLALLLIAVFNSGIYVWSEEMLKNTQSAPGTNPNPRPPPSYKDYSNVPTTEQQQVVRVPVTNKTEGIRTRQDATSNSTEQEALKQDKDDESVSQLPPPPFDADLVPRDE